MKSPRPMPAGVKPTYGYYLYQPVRTPAGVGLVQGFVRGESGNIIKIIVSVSLGCGLQHFNVEDVKAV